VTICLIPARGGSQRIPGKNIKDFHGKPIIAYSIETALESKLFDRVIVSSDDSETWRIGEESGATFLRRETEFAADEVGTQEVAQHELKDLETILGDIGEYACVIYPCSPLLEAEDLIDGFMRLKETGVDYVYSTDRKGIDCGNFYFGKTEAFIEGRPLDRSSLKFYIPKNRAIDINTEDDWERAEQMYEEIHG